MRTEVDVLARSLCHSMRWAMPGPKARGHAEDQLDALTAAGYVVVPRIELSRLLGYVAINLPRDDRLDDLTVKRGRKIVATLRALLPPSEDDDA